MNNRYDFLFIFDCQDANPNGDPAFWTPAPLLARLAAEGKTFTGGKA